MDSRAAAPNSDPASRKDSHDDALRVVCARCATTNRVPRARLGDGAKCGYCKELLLPGKPFELSKATFDRQIATTDLPLVVDFWAPWCGPCQATAPEFEKAAARLEPRLRLVKVNVDGAPTLARRYGIRSIPTLLLLLHGRELARSAGAMSAAQLESWLQRQQAA